ncbi:hypothetical protein SAMN04487988_102203 [Algoriphagus hitonicola]|uniref:Uncharacterized protein n=1 Tax=Algoriphagus hitonicola TaxID=435880 RepID=A0A1I2QD93_9BACT|nr:hypothetical protein SAMN04487988_102203 [Algoriphagus hitonicola]
MHPLILFILPLIFIGLTFRSKQLVRAIKNKEQGTIKIEVLFFSLTLFMSSLLVWFIGSQFE